MTSTMPEQTRASVTREKIPASLLEHLLCQRIEDVGPKIEIADLALKGGVPAHRSGLRLRVTRTTIVPNTSEGRGKA